MYKITTIISNKIIFVNKEIYIFYILVNTIYKLSYNYVLKIRDGRCQLNNNRKVKREIKRSGKKTYVSEVQEFNKPEGYEDAFKKYFPEQK